MTTLNKKNFDNPDETMNPEKMRVDNVDLGNGVKAARLTSQPGWKWSVDVSPLSGTDFCEVEHLGMVISGQATCAFKDGEIHTMKPGDLFYIGPQPHDSWVVGDEEYVSLHFQGADKYAD